VRGPIGQWNRHRDEKVGQLQGHCLIGTFQSGEIFLQEVGINRKGGFGPLGGGYNDPLDRAGGIAGHIETAKMRRLVLSRANGPLLVELTTAAAGGSRP
jgi:hypothetical protein